MAAYLAQTTDISAAARRLGCSWRSVRRIVERDVGERLDPGRLKGLKRIGIDEFSYRKRHRYLTVVVDHDRRSVVWATPGRSAEALDEFFEALGPSGRGEIELVTIDMAGGYIKAVGEHLPEAAIVFDRFHVQRLVSDAVDAVRREQLRDLRGTAEGKALFRSRFSLLRNPWNQDHTDRERLAKIAQQNKKLYRAYQLKVDFLFAFSYSQPKRAENALRSWLAWASRSRLPPFVRVARTVREHFDGILAYFHSRLTNGLSEGINNRLRMIARRAFGFHSPNALISLLYLCCGGIKLDPPLPGPT
jgi:transposase